MLDILDLPDRLVLDINRPQKQNAPDLQLRPSARRTGPGGRGRSAAEARELGIVQRLCEPAELNAVVDRIVHSLNRIAAGTATDQGVYAGTGRPRPHCRGGLAGGL